MQGDQSCSSESLNCTSVNYSQSISRPESERFVWSNKVINGLCPEGSYCPQGIPIPILCPSGTFLAKTSMSYPGRYVCDCVSCGPGYFCTVGSKKPTLCPPGHYCPEVRKQNDSTPCTQNANCNVFSIVEMCPPGTYQSLSGQSSAQSCLKCGHNFSFEHLTGYYCPDSGSFKQKLCPSGHFCVPGDPAAYPCPSGTFRSSPGGLGNLSCSLCLLGKYCPKGSIMPISCPGSFYCPSGSEAPLMCTGGHFCSPNSSLPAICPAGTFCMNGSEVPSLCPAGTFCPAQTIQPVLCPLGTYADVNSTVNRTTIENSCQNCPRGFFGADPLRLSCEKCFEGFLCFGITSSRAYGTTRGDPTDLANEGGEICPVGHFCPLGSFKASPCGKGRYNQRLGSYNASNCTKCPENYFNNQTGQDTCYPCGGTSYSSDDQTFCQCKGRNRVFQSSDSACRCLPGYVIFDSSGNPTTDGNLDGVLDCELRSLDRCDAGDIRGQDGACIQSCDDSICRLPPCFCKKGTQKDYCNGTCPDFQISRAQTIQVSLSVLDILRVAIVCISWLSLICRFFW